MAPTNPTPARDEPWGLYADLSTPVVVTDADGRVVFLNARAETLWGLRLTEAAGRQASATLKTITGEIADTAEWARTTLMPALSTETPVPCLVVGRDGQPHPVLMSGTWMTHEGRRYAVVLVVDQHVAGGDPPDWALRDPLTGLHNLHRWQRESKSRDARAGTVVFYDLDDLKEINDLYGHPMGDQALAVAGRALAAALPTAALLVRYGGDEFVAVLDTVDAAQALAFAERAVAWVAAAGEAAGMPIALKLGYGVAAFAPGGLTQAVQRADEALYEGKGILLRSSAGGRIVLAREARGRLLAPGRDREEARPGAFAAQFGPEFDGYFRQMFARAAAAAQEFVKFVDPVPGSAVVEVGAGSGRITFDGGLAERIGPQGQLLVTDPSAAQMGVARARAHDLGLEWVRFLEVPVEDLPLASSTADLVVGCNFVHFTDPAACVRSMARIVRPGGRVAIDQPVEMTWGRAWLEVLEPVYAELRAHGLPERDYLPGAADLEAAFAGAGLRLDRFTLLDPERGEFPDPEIAILFCRQVAFIPLMLKGVPSARHAPVREAMEARLAAVFPTASDEDRSTLCTYARIIGRKPE